MSNDAKLLKKFQEQADKGDLNAIFNLGNAYFQGKLGLEKDEKKAIEYWQRAAAKGHPSSMVNLAGAYVDGKVVEANPKKAVSLWRQASQAGDVSAMYNLATCFWTAEKTATLHDRSTGHMPAYVAGLFVKLAAVAIFSQFLMTMLRLTFEERSESHISSIRGIVTEEVFREKAGESLQHFLDDSLWRTSYGYTRTSRLTSAKDGLKERLYESQTEISGKLAGRFIDFDWTVGDNIWVGNATFDISDALSTSWVAIGFSPIGGMNKADIIMLRQAGDGAVLEDRYSEKVGVPTLDESQDVTLEEYSWGKNQVSFTFSRQRNTNDEEDWIVSPTLCFFIWAAGTGELPKGHYFRHTQLIDMFRGGCTPEDVSQLAPSSYLELMHDVDFKFGIILNSTSRAQSDRGPSHLFSRLLTLLWCSSPQGKEGMRDVATYITRCEASEGSALLGTQTKKRQLTTFIVLMTYFFARGVLRCAFLENMVCFLAGLFFADFYSYAAHVVLDCYPILIWPIFRPSAVGFQGHHEYPSGVLNTPYGADLNLMFIILSVPAGVASSIFLSRVLRGVTQRFSDDSQASSRLWARTFSIMFYFLYTSMFVMSCHAFAHMPKDLLPKWTQFLMKIGIILSSEVHIGHHIYYDRDFAVVNGWSNFIGNALGKIIDPQNEDWVYIQATILVLPLMMALSVELLLACQRLNKLKVRKVE